MGVRDDLLGEVYGADTGSPAPVRQSVLDEVYGSGAAANKTLIAPVTVSAQPAEVAPVPRRTPLREPENFTQVPPEDPNLVAGLPPAGEPQPSIPVTVKRTQPPPPDGQRSLPIMEVAQPSQRDVRAFDNAQANTPEQDMADAFAQAVTGGTTPGSFGEMLRVLTSGDPRAGFMRGSVFPGDIPAGTPPAPPPSAPELSVPKGPLKPMGVGTPQLWDFNFTAGGGAQGVNEALGSIKDVFDTGEFKARWQRTLGGLSRWRADVNADPEATRLGLLTDWQGGAEQAIDAASQKLFETRRLSQDPNARLAADATLTVLEQGPALMAAAAAARIGAPGLFVDLIGLGPMFTQVYGDSYARWGQYANTPGERARLALAEAIIEVAPEKLALEQYLKLAGAHSAEMIGAHVAKTTATEVGEEWLSDVGHFLQDTATIDPGKNLGGLLQDMQDSAKAITLAVPGLSLFGKAGHAAGGVALGRQGRFAREFEQVLNATQLPSVDVNNLAFTTEGATDGQSIPGAARPQKPADEQRGPGPRGDAQRPGGGEPPAGGGGSAEAGQGPGLLGPSPDRTLPDGKIEPVLGPTSEGVVSGIPASPEPGIDEATLRGLLPVDRSDQEIPLPPTTPQVSKVPRETAPTTPDTGPGPIAPETHPPSGIRTMTPEIRGELESMAKNAGWAEVGGRMIRNEQGEVTGRTGWIPHEPWWQGRAGGLDKEQTREAVRKALAGEALSRNETRAIDYMVEKAQERLATSRDFDAIGIPKRPENWHTMTNLERANELDPGRVESLATQFVDDDAAWENGIREILREHGEEIHGSTEAAPGTQGQAGGPTPAARQKLSPYGVQADLMGGQSESGQPTEFSLSPSPGPPTGPATNRKGKPPVSRLAAGQLDIFTEREGTTPAQSGTQPAASVGRFATRTGQVRLGTFRSGVKTVRTAQDAAHIFAPLRKEPLEHALMLVLDEGHHPIAMVRMGIGDRTQTSVYPHVMAQAVHSIPGARWIIFAHNHPSGVPEPSHADIKITELIRNTLRGTGVELMGATITAGDQTRTFGFEDAAGTQINEQVVKTAPQLRRGADIPEVGFRYFKNELMAGGSLSSPTNAREFIKNLPEPEGIVFLDAQNRARAWLPITAKELEVLRTGKVGEGASKLFQAINKSAAASMMLKLAARNTTASGNLHTFGRATDTTLLDSFYPGESGRWISEAEAGSLGRSVGVFRTAAETEPGVTADGTYPIYYSQLVRSIEALKQDTMPSDQWAGTLRNMARNGGAKQEEIDASGVIDWLEGAATSTRTKRQVLGYLRDHHVRVRSETLGSGSVGQSETMNTIGARLDAAGYDIHFDDMNAEVFTFTNRATGVEYAGPGYDREIVTGAHAFDDAPAHIQDLVLDYNRLAEIELGDARPDSGGARYASSNYVLPGGRNHVELVLSVPSAQPWGAFDTTHYGDIDGGRTVAWVRGNERTDADGKRVFFIEEIQSKRGEEGRKKGFAVSAEAAHREQLLAELARLREQGTNEADRAAYFKPGNIVKGYGGWDKVLQYAPTGSPGGHWKVQVVQVNKDGSPLAHETPRWHATDPSTEITRRIEHEVRRLDNRPPAAPFVTTTKSWVTLGFKRALRYAAENGFDRVAWTTGVQQAERYGLAHLVNFIAWTPDNPASEDRAHIRFNTQQGTIWVRVTDGKVLDSNAPHFVGQLLADIVGSEVAAEIASQPEGRITQEGLKVGGRGMREFYDRIIPNIAGDVLKKLGGPKVGTVDIGFPATTASGQLKIAGAGSQPAQAQPGFTITPDLRATVLKGVPMFTTAQGHDDVDQDVGVTRSEPNPSFARRLATLIGKVAGDSEFEYETVNIHTPHGREYSDAFNDVTARLPAAALRSIRGFTLLVDETHGTGGTFISHPNGGGFVTLSKWHLAKAAGGNEWARHKVRGWLAHEITHAMDAGNESFDETRPSAHFASATSARVGFDRDHLYASPGPHGDLFREAWDLFGQTTSASRPVRDMLKYPFINLLQGDMPDTAIKAELFAQMGRLYFTSRTLMQTHLPAWYATFEEIFNNGKNAQSVDEVRNRIRRSLSAGAGRPQGVGGALGSRADQGDGRGGRVGEIPGGLGAAQTGGEGGSVAVRAEDELRPDAIRAYVSEVFGSFTSEGIMGRSKKKYLGFYRPNYHTIHLANRNDLDTLAHEVGHHISNTERSLRSVMKHFQGELLKPPFAHPAYVKADKKKRIEEGFAEFIRLYMTDRAVAARDAPGFTAAFEAFLNANPKYKEPIAEFTRRVQENRNAPPEVRILGKTGVAKPTLKEALEAKTGRTARDAIVYQTLDRWKPLNRAVESLQPGILPSKNPYIAARLLAGDSAMVEDWLTRWTIPFDTRARLDKRNFGKPLMAILDPVLKDDETGRKFTAYIIARRAAELRADQRENLYTADEIQAGLSLQTPEFDAVADELYQFSDQLLQYRIDAGILTPELADKFREFEAYIPFFRMADGFQSPSPGSSHGIKIHRLKGGTANLRDVIENTILNASRTIRAANRNHVVQLLADLVRATPGSGHFAEEIPVPQTVLALDTQKIIDALKEQGVTVDESTAQNLAVQQLFFQQKPVTDERKGVLIFMRDGKYKALQINDAQLWDALNRMEPQEIGLLTSMFAFPARLARAGIVLAPQFFVSNFFRDTLSATVQAKSTFIPVISSLQGISKGLEVRAGSKVLKQMGDSAVYYRALGGAYADMWHNDTEEMKGALERMARHSLIDKALILSPAGIVRLLERVGGAVEIGARITEFEGVTKQMIDAGMDPVDAAIAATYAGREVSTDFAQHGADQTLRTIARTTMFLNPALQGLRKTGKVAAGVEGRAAQLKAMMVGGAMMLSSLLLYLANRDQEWFKDIEDWERNTYWHFRIAGETYRIPKPFEYGLFFSSIPEALLQYYLDRHGPELRDRVMQGLGMVLGFRVVPHVPSVLMQWAYNYDDFAGRPIVPDAQNQIEPELQAGARTSLASRTLAKGTARVGNALEGAGYPSAAAAVKTSPLKTDFVVRQLFGGLGQYVVMAADQTLRLVGDYPPQPEMHWREYPVINKFIHNPDTAQSRDMTRFYKELETIRRAAQSVKQYGDEEAARYETLHAKELDRVKEAERTAKAIAQQRKQAREVYEDPKLTGSQKRGQLNEIYGGMRQEARDYIEER